MKIKIYSWILAGAYLLCGAAFFCMVLKAREIFSGFNIELPFMTRMALAIGPVGWLCALVVVGALVILKDMRFHSRLLNPFFTVSLGLSASLMVFALLAPLRNIDISIH